MSAPGTAGQDPLAADSVTVIDWNDLAALERELSNGDVAAVIMEPLNVNGGCLEPAPGYLEGVSELTRRLGVVLIFDEVITGFRLAPGGAQEHYGVTPDLTVLGKALGAGFPISAVCGSRAVIETVASGTVAHVGTFNANPVCAAAALAALDELEQQRDEIYRAAGGERPPARADHDRGICRLLDAAPRQPQCGRRPRLRVVSPRRRPTRTRCAPTARPTASSRRVSSSSGVHVIPRGLLYVSSEHTAAELDETGEALVRSPPRSAPRWRSLAS